MKRHNRTRRAKKIISKSKVQNAQKLQAYGKTFKSKLEKFTYDKLIEFDITDFKYEEEKFTLVEPFSYNNDSIEAYERSDRVSKTKVKSYGLISPEIRAMTYLPDFTMIRPDKTGWLIEVKGYSNDALNHFKIRSAFK